MKKKASPKKDIWFNKVTAPFKVLKIEKFYLFWIFSYFISFGGVIIDLFNNDIANIISTGMIYSTCMAVIAPLFIEFLSEYISANRQRKAEEYSTYKGWTMGICFACLIFLFLFYVTKLRSYWFVQISSLVIVFVISFYTYLVTKMQLHNTILEKYKDESYVEAESKELQKMKGSSKKLKKTENSKGVEVKL